MSQTGHLHQRIRRISVGHFRRVFRERESFSFRLAEIFVAVCHIVSGSISRIISDVREVHHCHLLEFDHSNAISSVAPFLRRCCQKEMTPFWPDEVKLSATSIFETDPDVSFGWANPSSGNLSLNFGSVNGDICPSSRNSPAHLSPHNYLFSSCSSSFYRPIHSMPISKWSVHVGVPYENELIPCFENYVYELLTPLPTLHALLFFDQALHEMVRFLELSKYYSSPSVPEALLLKTNRGYCARILQTEYGI
jgi:hypothetical protein